MYTNDISSHFLSLPPCELVQTANSSCWWTVRFRVGEAIEQDLAKSTLHTGTVKIGPHKFCHFKYYSHVAVKYLAKIYQKHLFLCGKTEK